MRRVMHIDLDAFFVSVEQVRNPELKGKPVVVGGRPGTRGVVATASYEARKYGLHSGMPLVTASRLCPQAIFVEGHFALYREASRKFMAILADFSPFIEIAGIDEAYLEVTGFESLHGSIYGMAQAIRQRVRSELQLPASVGIAGNKLVAKVASDEAKPDGIKEVLAGEEAIFLAPLPVGKLSGVGKKTEPMLRRLGVGTIGELAGLPSDMLKKRLGSFGEYLVRAAKGIDNRPVEPPGEAKSVSRETTFTGDISSRDYLEAMLRYLSERVGADLRRKKKQGQCVFIKLRYADFTTITRRLTLKMAVDADTEIYIAAQQMMAKALLADKRPVRLLGVGVTSFQTPARQFNMLEEKKARLERLNLAIDHIRSRHGFPVIQTGRTFYLKDYLQQGKNGYHLHTPGLSR